MSMPAAPSHSAAASDPAADRRYGVAVGVTLLVEALVLGFVCLYVSQPTILPVTVELTGEPRRMLAEVDAGMAAAVLCAVAGITLLVGAPARVSAGGSADLAVRGSARLAADLYVRGSTGGSPDARVGRSAGDRTGRRRIARWAGFSVTSSATVFLVAALNGITDVGALVLTYAITSGIALFGILQDRGDIRFGHPLLPLCFSAAIGIVPWGVIAFHQIGAGLVGDGPSVLVRVVTLAMLAFAFGFWLADWRTRRSRASGERMFQVLTVLSASAFGWLVVIGALAG